MKDLIYETNSTNWQPNDKDIAFYNDNGWFITPLILPEELLNRAEAGIKSFYKGHRDHYLPEWASKFDWNSDQGNVLRLNNYLCLQMDAVRELIFSPLLGRTAAFLAKTPAIRLYKDSAIIKPPSLSNQSTNVGWHTDRSYWMMCTAENMLTAWIPFQDCDSTNGSIAVIEGSHAWPLNHDMRTFNNQDMVTLEEKYIKKYGDFKKRVLKVNRGQISFHDCRLIHGSMENNSKKLRAVLAVHLQTDHNRYRVFPDKDGRPLSHLNDLLCRTCEDGTPDYCDPDIFPELWRNTQIKS